MDYGKIDGALAGALTPEQDMATSRLSVFIRTNPDLPPAAAQLLQKYGLDAALESVPLLSLELSPSQIEELSEQPWVKSIKLARIARPLSG